MERDARPRSLREQRIHGAGAEPRQGELPLEREKLPRMFTDPPKQGFLKIRREIQLEHPVAASQLDI